MIVVERKPAPVYEVKCWECGSKIHYKASEVIGGFISCPVCGVSIMALKIHPVKTEATSSAGKEDTP